MSRGFAWVLKALLSHYWRHPWQALFQALGLVAGVALWSAVQVINQHAEDSYRQARNLLGVEASHFIRNRRGEGITTDLYSSLRRSGFRQIFPLLELEVSTGEGVSISIVATDLLALPDLAFGDDSRGDFATEWIDFTRPPYRSWFPQVLARELAIEPGDRLLLRDGRRLPPARTQTREQQGRRVFMDIGAAMALSGRDRIGYLAVGRIEPDEYRRLAESLPEGLELVENQQHIDLRELTASLHTHLTAMSLLSFAVGLFIVFNAVRFSLWYRRSTLLDLRLLGCSARQLLAAVTVETLLWSLLGALPGFLFGILLADALLPGLGSTLQSLYGANVAVELGFDPFDLLKAWAMTLLGLIWALTWPLYRLLTRSTMPGGGMPQISRESKSRSRLARAALLAGILAAFAYGRIESATGGFVVLGLMLFAAAWLLPTLLAAGLRLVAVLIPPRRLVLRWLVSDGWSQLPAFQAAMMALLLALTANLGVGTLVDSFRNAFVGWLEVRQSADIYLRLPHADLARFETSNENAGWLADSHRRIGVSIRWQGRPALVRGLDPRAPDSLALPLSQWQGASAAAALASWREQKGKVLINEQVHYLAGVGIGDMIELESDSGAQKYEVVGVFYDYGNPYFQFYLPGQVLANRWKHHYSRGMALWLNPGNENAMQEAEASLASLGAEPGDWISQDQVRRLSIGIFDRTFAITASMNLLTLVIAAVALMTSLLAILQERLPQFAQWRALGVRQGEQLLLVAIPLLSFCALAWLMAVPLGASLSWILIHKINIVSFGWSMPLDWKFAPAAKMAAVVLAICVATLAVVSWQWRRKISPALAQLGDMD